MINIENTRLESGAVEAMASLIAADTYYLVTANLTYSNQPASAAAIAAAGLFLTPTRMSGVDFAVVSADGVRVGWAFSDPAKQLAFLLRRGII